MKKYADAIAFILILFFAAAADSIADSYGTFAFLLSGIIVMGVSWILIEVSKS